MQLSNEKKVKYYNFTLDLEEDEYRSLVDYAIDNITIEEQDSLLIQWAIIDILKRELDEMD